MRKRLVYAGVFVILVSVAFVIVSATMQNMKKVPVKNVLESWEISENLQNEVTYVFDIYSSYQWRDNWTQAGGYSVPQPVDVVIVSPGGNETTLQAFFLARLPETQPYMSTFPLLVYVEYAKVDSDYLTVDRSYPQVRFTVRKPGNFTARVIGDTINWTSGPPRELIVFREVVETQPMYTVFLQGGGVLFLVGITVSVVGAKARPSKKIRSKQITRK